MGNVGIIGRARVGKDTAGAWFVENRGYQRVSFADPLRECALKLDPIIVPEDERSDWGEGHVRLSQVIAGMGWERAKDEYPEVRRTLQRIGQGIRAIDPNFWLRTALKEVTAANEGGQPCVITDVRYPNEAASLRRAGFHLVYIHRPDVPQLVHESEGAVTADVADHIVINNESLADLQREIHLIADKIYAAESRKHYARSL
ncbi:deoxynucleotide monophosphate kinase family protein [Streptomyces chryseus]|uniref:deoxynucleotide monophosphate kinase family protein n=1 Tax=Streptomyces chryseus TaxID=68186 RepID=UPI00110F8285|nr:hypothetical protein [Streptomyces chryseus]GGX26895.1 hypothetical protein GCM10010353_47570 [Streptomyces chryseus]